MKEGFLLENVDRIKSKTKNSIGINITGFILTTMAGWVDTIGVALFLGQRLSSMTGRGHTLGYWAYNRELKMFLVIALIIISFIIGAAISTRITGKIGLTGGLLFTGVLIIIGSFPFNLQNSILSAVFVPMAMGCQNSATSLTEIKRSTHLTGAATDIGINVAKGNWKIVRFWIYRWIGFPIGSFIGFNLVNLVKNNKISGSVTLIIPAIIIMLTGILQKKFLDIPLLDE